MWSGREESVDLTRTSLPAGESSLDFHPSNFEENL